MTPLPFTPVWTPRVEELLRKKALASAGHRFGLVNDLAVRRLETECAIEYGRANGRPWIVPQRLQRYGGLHRLLRAAKRAGCEFFLVPAGWFAHTGDIAMTHTHAEGAVIFIEDRPVNPFETTDTVLHETVHAVGPALGRTQAYDNLPRTEVGYWQEEAVAMLGASRLATVLNLPRLVGKTRDALENIILKAAEATSPAPLDRELAKRNAQSAVDFLLKHP